LQLHHAKVLVITGAFFGMIVKPQSG